MTDLQDEICDRLVGATIGRNWVGGPLHVAALVIDPSFVPTNRNDARPGQFARAVGWPVLFCEAVSGANAVLNTEDDRRSLAIALFSRILPSRLEKRPAPLSGKVSRSTVTWAVLRGHESACGVACPLHAATITGLATIEAGGEWAELFWNGIDCQTAPGRQNDRVTPRSPAAHHAVVALRYLDAMMRNPGSHFVLGDALRESAKAETKVHGLDGAAAFCLDLAEKLDLNSFDRQDRGSRS